MPMSPLPAAILSHMIAVSNVPPPPLRSIPSEWGKPVGSSFFFFFQWSLPQRKQMGLFRVGRHPGALLTTQGTGKNIGIPTLLCPSENVFVL